MPQPAVSCLALAEPDCTKVGLAVLARLAGRTPVSSILITASGDCAERCPPTLAARPLGDARIESATSISIASWRANQIGGIDVDEPEDAGAFIAAPPDSPPAGGGSTPYSLGHCGLFSGVDVDGSYWDPVGLITDHPAAANSADGVVAFTGPDTAVFRTADGFTVALARHVGPKLSLPCM
jgi:hypothetical protein